MIRQIYHVGLTVSDMDRSIAFYRDVQGLTLQGELLMEGPERETIFQRKNCLAKAAYLNGLDKIGMPLVELIQFLDADIEKQPADLT